MDEMERAEVLEATMHSEGTCCGGGSGVCGQLIRQLVN